ncbi:MAG: hypothetical protein MAG458_00874 [Nitrosopumilus sp.]|nr:hypothetical protein [Nitrosopumilus sp.]
MVLPIIILVTIPIFLGIAYVTPFDMPASSETEQLPEESDGSILYFMLVGIWIFFLLRILILLKRGRYKLTQRY